MFKACTCCEKNWTTADEFVNDAKLTFIGIQEDSEPRYTAAAFLCHCGTSLYVLLKELMTEASGAIDQILQRIRWRSRENIKPAPTSLAYAIETLRRRLINEYEAQTLSRAS